MKSKHFSVALRGEVDLVTGGRTSDRTRIDSVELFVPPATIDLRDVGQWINVRQLK